MYKLTAHQLRILVLAAEGLNDESIARRVNSGHVAVRTNMCRIYSRLGIAAENGQNPRVAAVLWYQQQTGKRA